MIKKLFLIITIIMLVISGVQAVTIKQNGSEIKNKIEKVTFSEQLIIGEKDNYLSIDIEDTDVKLEEIGKPMLPVYRTTFTFSQNARIISISCDYSDIKEKKISGKIIPAPEFIPYSLKSEGNINPIYKEDKNIYESDALYPDNWFDYSIRCGLNSDGVSTTFVTIELHPVRYSPKQNMLYYMTDFIIHVSYEDPGSMRNLNADSYDLVIIAPSAFSKDLQPLIDHKISHGMNTILKTTEEIYTSYQGRDKPEKIKYFIKDAKENLNTNYVLLVGGLKSYLYAKDRDDTNQGSTAWHVPVRYAHISHADERSCISDLYYGDLYRYNETSQEWEFDDWDSNGDGIFARWTPLGGHKDKLDLVPDIYFGRLPCRNNLEVKIMVRKIIVYESSSPDKKPWFKKMIGIGGLTFEIYEGVPDGEYACDIAMEYMGNLINNEVRIYASNEGTSKPTIPDDIVPEITKGAGYVIFQGHGNPVVWDTHPVDTTEVWLKPIMVNQLFRCLNIRKFPIVIVGGCHNALFNISILQILLNRKNEPHYYWSRYPSPVCFCWGLCLVPYGGAIASTGCTGYGFGDFDSYSGALETGFFYEIGQNNASYLGEAHSGAIRTFFLKHNATADRAFCTTIWQLFGDPSLRLGGYP